MPGDKKDSNSVPHYVVNIPLKVESDSDNATSCGSDCNLNEFSSEMFENPELYFRLAAKIKNNNKRGTLLSKDYLPNQASTTPLNKSKSKEAQLKLVKQFTEETFGKSVEESKGHAEKRMSVVLGLNKMRSLSQTRNKSLQRALDLPITSTIDLNKFGFFWDGYWQKYNPETDEWDKVNYRDVLKFYRTLKSKNINKAKQFRRAVEKSRGHMVPYRELRERIKNHQFTKESVSRFRKNNAETPVYLSIFDSDSRRLNPSGTGVFKYYDAMIAQNISQFNKELEVGSVGYMFTGASKDHVVNPLITVGVELDLWTRHVTAKFFKFGIYYPEPCFIARVPSNHETVQETFTERSTNYTSPQESIILLKNIIDSRKIDPQNTFAFDARGAIETNTPDRAQTETVAHENDSGLIVRWREASLRAMRHISQSHFHTKKWVDNLLKALTYKNEVIFKIDKKIIKINSAHILEQMRKSIIARIFKHYDAISIAKTLIQRNNMIFPKALIETLQEYNPEAIPLEPVNQNKQRKHKEQTKSKTISATDVDNIWNQIDSIESLSQLTIFLSKFIENSHVKKIMETAKEVGKTCVDILKKRLSLNFSELSMVLMEDYFSKLQLREAKEISSTHFPVIHKAVIENTLLNEDDGLKRQFVLSNVNEHNRRDIYGATPLHWAAMTGNKNIINKIKELVRSRPSTKWLGEAQSEAHNKVLPIHCALQFCIQHGVDEVLLSLLLNHSIINNKTSDNKTLLATTLLEADNPIPIIEVLFKFNALPNKLRPVLIELIKKTPQRQGSSLLISLMHNNISEDEIELLKALIEYGINPNEPGLHHQNILDNKWDNIFSNFHNSSMTYPIFAAIKTGNVKLVESLLRHKPKASLYDERGRTLIIAALEADYNQLAIVKLLHSYGVDINATCANECCTPLNIICKSGASDKNLAKYIVERSKDIETENTDGLTPLKIAIKNTNPFVIELLLEIHTDTDDLTREETKYIRSHTKFKKIYGDEDKRVIANKQRKKSIDNTRNIMRMYTALGGGDFGAESLPLTKQQRKYYEKTIASEILDSMPDYLQEDLLGDEDYGYYSDASMTSGSNSDALVSDASNSEDENDEIDASEEESEEHPSEEQEPEEQDPAEQKSAEEEPPAEQDADEENASENDSDRSRASAPSEEDVEDTSLPSEITQVASTANANLNSVKKPHIPFQFFRANLPQAPTSSAKPKSANKRALEPVAIEETKNKTIDKKARVINPLNKGMM